MIKKCKNHGLTEFVKRKDNSYRCKKCAVEAVQKRRDKLKENAVKYKGGKCQNEKCGYNKYIGALDFHHLDPNKKDFGVSAKGYTYSWENVKKELDKCIMLCSNCHREVHGGYLDISNLSTDVNFEVIDKKDYTNYCCDCGVVIDRKAKRCKKCYNLLQRKVNRPPYEQLRIDIEATSYLAVGRKYGVSDTTIRKWLKQYEETI
jgi:hypothetical protein